MLSYVQRFDIRLKSDVKVSAASGNVQLNLQDATRIRSQTTKRAPNRGPLPLI